MVGGLHETPHIVEVGAFQCRDLTPYDSAYDAFINYMNVLSDFIIELDKAVAAKAAKAK